MKKKLIAMICLATILLSSFCAQASFGSIYLPAYICNCKDYATLRSWPSPKASALERVYLGECVTILSREYHNDKDMDFVLVETEDGQAGYVWLNCVRLIDIEHGGDDYDHDYGYGYVTLKDADLHSNLRTGPGIDYPSIGYLFGGEKVPYLGRKDKAKNGRIWYCCEVDNTTCWVSSRVADLYRRR